INDFVKWHRNFGDVSYDRMDFWGSQFGIFAKRVFYKSKLVGAPFALIGLLLENYLPNVQKLFAKPHREVIGDAHFALAYMNLYELNGDNKYLDKAESLMNDMLC